LFQREAVERNTVINFPKKKSESSLHCNFEKAAHQEQNTEVLNAAMECLNKAWKRFMPKMYNCVLVPKVRKLDRDLTLGSSEVSTVDGVFRLNYDTTVSEDKKI